MSLTGDLYVHTNQYRDYNKPIQFVNKLIYIKENPNQKKRVDFTMYPNLQINNNKLMYNTIKLMVESEESNLNGLSMLPRLPF